MLADQTIVFDAAGTITAVGPTSTVRLPAGTTAIDLSNAACLPGLIDVHTHLTGDPTGNGYVSLGISIPREAVTGAKNARLTVRAGFTTVRNVGASGYTYVAVRDGIDAGEIEGPPRSTPLMSSAGPTKSVLSKPATTPI
jgi:imidazolonepropionase-like amidohydrolase